MGKDNKKLRNPDHTPFVLVVEDDSIIRIGLVDALEEAGFRVVDAATGAAGLSALKRDEKLTALLTDIEMPGTLDGLALARIVHERRPDAAVIVMSGRVRPGAGALPPNARFFDKPYRHDDIVASLQELLELDPGQTEATPD